MKRALFAVCTIAAAFASHVALGQAPAAAPPAAAPAPPYGAPITLEQAKTVVAVAEAEARKRGAAVTIAVAEPNGTLVLTERMTGATYSSAETAPNKAKSAALWMRPTAAWAEVIKNNPGALNNANVVASQGGELIIVGGRTIGAIGVGGSAAHEGEIAKIAVAAIK